VDVLPGGGVEQNGLIPPNLKGSPSPVILPHNIEVKFFAPLPGGQKTEMFSKSKLGVLIFSYLDLFYSDCDDF